MKLFVNKTNKLRKEKFDTIVHEFTSNCKKANIEPDMIHSFNFDKVKLVKKDLREMREIVLADMEHLVQSTEQFRESSLAKCGLVHGKCYYMSDSIGGIVCESQV